MFIRDKISIKQNKVTQFCLIDIMQNWIDQMGALLHNSPSFLFTWPLGKMNFLVIVSCKCVVVSLSVLAS